MLSPVTLEAIRKNKYADLMTATINGTDNLDSDQIFKNIFQSLKKKLKYL